MPERQDINDILEERNIDLANPHNMCIRDGGNILPKYGIISPNKMLFAAKFEDINKHRFIEWLTNLDEYITICQLNRDGIITGDKFVAEDEDLYVYKDDDKIKIVEGNVFILNQFSTIEIYEDIDYAKKNYDVML